MLATFDIDVLNALLDNDVYAYLATMTSKFTLPSISLPTMIQGNYEILIDNISLHTTIIVMSYYQYLDTD